MALSTIDHLVAATLAASRAATFDFVSRDEYLAEYDAFLRLMVARDGFECCAPSSCASDAEASAREARHIPRSI
jgi:hypothetical protein